MLGHGHSNEVEKTRVDGQNPKQPPMKYELILNNHLLIKEIDFSMQFWKMSRVLMRWVYIWEHLTILFVNEQKALVIFVSSH